MAMFETNAEIAEGKREGWLTSDGRVTNAGHARGRFESALSDTRGKDSRQVCRRSDRRRVFGRGR